MSSIDISYLSSNQPNAGGVSIKATHTQKLVSFNYIIFSGSNITDPSVQNEFINGTLNVGNEHCSLISEGAGSYTYHLFIDTTEVLCTADYYIVVSGLQLDGTQTDFQTEPLVMPLTPAQITLGDDSVFITRVQGDYTDAVITVLFDPVECEGVTDGDTISYIVAIQYLGGNGEWYFQTNEEDYNPYLGEGDNLGGVSVSITSGVGVDDAYVAIQAVRTVTGGFRAIGQLSETKQANDSEVPQPPTNLAVDYQYSEVPPLAVLTWNAPSSASFTDLTSFKVYRQVNNGGYSVIGTVPYVEGTSSYTFNDDVSLGSGLNADDVLYYYVVSVNPNGQSGPSNIVSITLVAVSSPPQNISALGLRQGVNDVGVQVLFQNPAIIGGDIVCDYANAYFVVQLYDESANPDVLLVSQTIEYSDEEDAAYEVNFQDVPFETSYKVVVYLVTFNPNEDCAELNGQSGSALFTAGYAPLIYSINGLPPDQWEQDTPITSMVVYSFTNLVGGIATEVDVPTGTPPQAAIHAINLLTDTNYPYVLRTVTSPYEAFQGAFEYVWSDLAYPGGNIVSVVASNPNGVAFAVLQGNFVQSQIA